MRVRSCTGTGRCAAHPEIPLKDTGARRADTGKSDTRPGTDGTVFSKKTQKKRRKNCPEKQLPAVNSLVQTANGILSRSWGLDLALLPGECFASLMETAQRIERIEIKFNQVKSAPAFAKIQALDAKIRKITTGKYTHRIQAIQNHIREITVLMQEVYDPDNRKTIEKNLEDYSRILSDYSAARYRSYQSWTVRKCNEAFQLYSSWIRVDEKDAIQVIDTYLTTIDSSLLAPETMKLYQDVLSKLFAEMGWKEVAKYEARLATSVKRTLEDF